MKKKGFLISLSILDIILIGVCVFLYLNQDQVEPIISFEENGQTYSESMDQKLLLEGVTAYDEQDGDVSDSLLIEKVSNISNEYVTVTYVALDRSNNVGRITRIMKTGKGEFEETRR